MIQTSSAALLAVGRRSLVAGALASLAAPAVVGRARAAAGTLRILSWEGYNEPAWVQPFEAKTGAKTAITLVGSADEMFAKMRGSNGRDYDVLAFDTSLFARYIGGKLIQPVDFAKLANASNLQPTFRAVTTTMRDGQHYGVPFAWGSLPLIYLKSAFPTAPDTWQVMWNPRYAQQIISQDDANNMITLGAIVVGVADPFNLTDADFDRIKAKLIEQKKLLLTYYAGFDDGVSIFASSGIKLMYSMGEPQVPSLQKKGVDAAMTIPKEGAIGWLDCWTISSGAQNLDLAHTWINGCLDKSVGAYLSNNEKYGNTTDQAANEANGVSYGDKLVWLQTPENLEKRVKVWNEIKAAG